jgi:hypothetical protein
MVSLFVVNLIQPAQQSNKFVAFVTGCVVKGVAGDMQKFVGERTAQDFDDLLRVLAFCQEFLRVLDFMTAEAFGMIPERTDGGYQLARFHPVHEAFHAGVDDGFSLKNRSLPAANAILHDKGQIIHGIQKHIVQIADFRFDKIGLCLRTLMARSTMPLPRIGSGLAVEVMTISAAARCSGRSFNVMAVPLKRLDN